MKKAVLTTMAIIISLATVLSITGFAMARTDPMPEEVVIERIGLIIEAPATVKAGQSLRIRVLSNPEKEPVAGAEVWGINIYSLANDTALTSDVASLRRSNGFLLGSTGNNGYIVPPPQIYREGNYVLVAIEPRFAPGFTMMKVTQCLPLTLRAPDTAPVDHTVTMRVTDPDGQGVNHAAIYVIPLLSPVDTPSAYSDCDQLLRDAEAYVEILDDPEAEIAADREAYERIIRMKGYLKGHTDSDGYFRYRFSQTGPHLLIAAKRGYVPDFQRIEITGSRLILSAPDTALVNRTVEIRPRPADAKYVAVFPRLRAVYQCTEE